MIVSTMRFLLSLSMAVLFLACASTEARGKDPERLPAASKEFLTPKKHCDALVIRVEARMDDDSEEAARLLRKAVEVLDPETDENIEWGRVILFDKLLWLHEQLGMEEPAGLAERKSAAYHRYEKVYDPGTGQRRPEYPLLATTTAPETSADLDGIAGTPPGETEEREPDSPSQNDEGDDQVRIAVTPDGSEDSPAPQGESATSSADSTSTASATPPESTTGGRARESSSPRNAGPGSPKLEEARSRLERLLRDLEARGLGNGPGAIRARKLLDALDSRAEEGGSTARDASATGAETGGSGRRVSDAFGPQDPSSLGSLLDGIPEDPSDAGFSSTQVGDIAYGAEDFERARQAYRDGLSKATTDEERFLAGMGLARVAEAMGEGAESLSFFEKLAADARDHYSPDHPLYQEAQARRARAVREAKGEKDFIAMLEEILAEQESRLNGDHPATQSTRRALEEAYADQGDLASAIDLQRLVFQSLQRTAPEGDPRVAEAGVALAELLERAGEHDAALRVLLGIEGSDQDTRHADPLRDLRVEALRLQRSCQLADALELRRRIVNLQREASEVDGSERAEGLRDLAAVLRVLGSASEAREVEAEARVADRTAPDPRDRLAASLAEVRGRPGRPDPGPVVALTDAGLAPQGRRRVVAEIEDPSGIRAVLFMRDRRPQTLALDDSTWSLDASGTRGRLELLVDLPEDGGPTVISVAAENFHDVQSDYEWIIVSGG